MRESRGGQFTKTRDGVQPETLPGPRQAVWLVYGVGMATPWDHLLAAVLVVGLPLRAVWLFRRLANSPSQDRAAVRKRLYLQAMAMQWTLVAGLAALWLATGRPWGSLGLVPRANGGFWGVLLGLLFVTPLLFRRLRSLDAATVAAARASFAPVESLLPRTVPERNLFYALSVTAGCCEELLYRGFLIDYFGRWTGTLQAMLLVAVLFGVGHAYQGLSGVLKTGIVGAFLGTAYLLTGSLLLPVIVHALMDVYAGTLAHRVLTFEPAPAAVERTA